jgi:hypothetical protein
MNNQMAKSERRETATNALGPIRISVILVPLDSPRISAFSCSRLVYRANIIREGEQGRRCQYGCG